MTKSTKKQRMPKNAKHAADLITRGLSYYFDDKNLVKDNRKIANSYHNHKVTQLVSLEQLMVRASITHFSAVEIGKLKDFENLYIEIGKAVDAYYIQRASSGALLSGTALVLAVLVLCTALASSSVVSTFGIQQYQGNATSTTGEQANYNITLQSDRITGPTAGIILFLLVSVLASPLVIGMLNNSKERKEELKKHGKALGKLLEKVLSNNLEKLLSEDNDYIKITKVCESMIDKKHQINCLLDDKAKSESGIYRATSYASTSAFFPNTLLLNCFSKKRLELGKLFFRNVLRQLDRKSEELVDKTSNFFFARCLFNLLFHSFDKTTGRGLLTLLKHFHKRGKQSYMHELVESAKNEIEAAIETVELLFKKEELSEDNAFKDNYPDIWFPDFYEKEYECAFMVMKLFNNEKASDSCQNCVSQLMHLASSVNYDYKQWKALLENNNVALEDETIFMEFFKIYLSNDPFSKKMERLIKIKGAWLETNENKNRENLEDEFVNDISDTLTKIKDLVDNCENALFANNKDDNDNDDSANKNLLDAVSDLKREIENLGPQLEERLLLKALANKTAFVGGFDNRKHMEKTVKALLNLVKRGECATFLQEQAETDTGGLTTHCKSLSTYCEILGQGAFIIDYNELDDDDSSNSFSLV